MGTFNKTEYNPICKVFTEVFLVARIPCSNSFLSKEESNLVTIVVSSLTAWIGVVTINCKIFILTAGVSKNCKLWKDWKQGNTSKQKYLEAKKKVWRAVYQAKCKAERKRFEKVMESDDQKCDVCKIIKRMIRTYQNISDEEWIRNDDGRQR